MDTNRAQRTSGAGDPVPNFHGTANATDGWIPAVFSDLAVHTFHDLWQVELDQVTIRSSTLQPWEVFGRYRAPASLAAEG